MTTVLWPYRAQAPYRAATSGRTNSLAFAKSDCHTCASLGLSCDRQRPRCIACQDSGRLCHGYSMKLTWQQSHSVSNKPPKVKATTSQATDTTTYQALANFSPVPDRPMESVTPRARGSRRFTFVAGRPAKRRKRHHLLNNDSEEQERGSTVVSRGSRSDRSTSSHQPASSKDLATFSPALLGSSLGLPLTPSFSPQESPFAVDLWKPTQVCLPEIDIGSPDIESLEQCLEIQHCDEITSAWSRLSTNSADDSPSELDYFSSSDYAYQHSLSYIPQMCFSTLHDKFSGLLEMCT